MLEYLLREANLAGGFLFMSTIPFALSPFAEAVAGMLLLCFVILALTWSFACLLDSVGQFIFLVRSDGERSLLIMSGILSAMGLTACGFLSYMAFSIVSTTDPKTMLFCSIEAFLCAASQSWCMRLLPEDAGE